MRSILKSVCATGLLTAMAIPPLAAAPQIHPQIVAKSNSVIDVQYRYHDRDRDGWYHGHRGYRERHPGYRYRNGWWFPPAAFITGAIVGSTIAPRRSATNAHVEWCYDRYRSYRAYDNTYQPYEGPRRQCYSPYS